MESSTKGTRISSSTLVYSATLSTPGAILNRSLWRTLVDIQEGSQGRHSSIQSVLLARFGDITG